MSESPEYIQVESPFIQQHQAGARVRQVGNLSHVVVQ
jgi:hypothetical protein